MVQLCALALLLTACSEDPAANSLGQQVHLEPAPTFRRAPSGYWRTAVIHQGFKTLHLDTYFLTASECSLRLQDDQTFTAQPPLNSDQGDFGE